MGNKRNSQPQILSGWKEIASYLRMGVRTAQRHENESALPIRRVAGKSLGTVFARRADLDAWLNRASKRPPSRSKARVLNKQVNRVGAEFLRIDCETGLTFAALALGTTDPETRRRTYKAARKAYQTIVRLRKNLDLSDVESNKLDIDLQRLKSELERLANGPQIAPPSGE